MANWSRCPNQPQIGWRSAGCRSRRTYRNAGAPGPPLRYLYVHPTARSTPAEASGTSIEPAECDRSHSVSAPTACAAAVMPGRSATAPERYATCDSDTRATSSSSAATTSAVATPRSMSDATTRTLMPRAAARPSSTYRSVGKLSSSVTITDRPGRASHAATASL